MQELGRQLDSWRVQLPVPLQWSDDELAGALNLGTSPTDARSSSTLPTTDFDAYFTNVGLEMTAVEIRARFYFARFILGRTYIFKALHFPAKMEEKDVELCGSAIAAGCMLPAALAPARQNKRLLPHLFTWTQNFIAMLIILRTARTNECLRNICEECIAAKHLEHATSEMLHWIRDVKQIDGIADWSWRFLPGLSAPGPSKPEA